MKHNQVAAPVDRFAFAAGVIGFVIIGLFLVSNFALGDADPPKPAASAQEISTFYLENAGKLEWAVGMRFVEFVLAPFLAFGLARHVRGSGNDTLALAAIALMAQIWVMATGTVANTLESILIFQADELASEPELARMLSLGMNGLFSVALLGWALVVFCLSEAGRRSKMLPLWLSGLGYIQALGGVIAGVALARTLEQEENVFGVAELIGFVGFALWLLLASSVLLREGWRAVRAQT